MYVCMIILPQTLTVIIYIANGIIALIKLICTLIMFDGQTYL